MFKDFCRKKLWQRLRRLQASKDVGWQDRRIEATGGGLQCKRFSKEEELKEEEDMVN
ncbi:hypothetical protein BY996DRAFT_6545683 [Phakopsora pachyrhizi]|uniref:Uncharacterized protein n=1 Tax=Phakopsora pachyrhizi TaxID=170000 RepID=A0AAV0AR40_PHAPC|nr:hypothetical protein BY996DRAFT_6545683 [Phakopsora pachyrhizi]CAH7671003.1 hypothetical protein PPACK8108_LOCUS5751 [Phakopsora pachyrhizi]